MSPWSAGALAAIIAVGGTPIARGVARRMRLLDVPNERSSHAIPTPRTGGYAIVAAIAVATLAAGVLDDARLRAIAIAATVLAILAMIDEWRDLSRVLRFGVQLVVVVALVQLGGLVVGSVELPPGWTVHFGPLAFPLAVLWLVWGMNAYNFMDGVNGLAAVEAVICGGTMAVLFARDADPAAAMFAAAIAGAALGFLPWNFPNASIFMGDVASASFGLLFGALSLRFAHDGRLIEGSLPLMPFLLDATMTVVTRMARGEPFYYPHKLHFYQRLAQQGYSHCGVTTIWGTLALLSGLLAVAYRGLSPGGRLAGLLALVLSHVAVGMYVQRKAGRRRPSVS